VTNRLQTLNVAGAICDNCHALPRTKAPETRRSASFWSVEEPVIEQVLPTLRYESMQNFMNVGVEKISAEFLTFPRDAAKVEA
jgi:cytochrome c5